MLCFFSVEVVCRTGLGGRSHHACGTHGPLVSLYIWNLLRTLPLYRLKCTLSRMLRLLRCIVTTFLLSTSVQVGTSNRLAQCCGLCVRWCVTKKALHDWFGLFDLFSKVSSGFRVQGTVLYSMSECVVMGMWPHRVSLCRLAQSYACTCVRQWKHARLPSCCGFPSGIMRSRFPDIAWSDSRV